MTDYTLDADGFGSFYLNVGGNGSDDHVTVNIGEMFSGTITVDSLPGDGETDIVSLNLPEGWRLELQNVIEQDTETPTFHDWSYQVFNAAGESVGTLSLRSNNDPGSGVPCFASGTLIATPGGEVAIEHLRAGDIVLTRDSGPRPIRWIGSRLLDQSTLAASPHLRPVRIRAGALGPGQPRADLVVSPQHRILVRSIIAERMFGAAEVLVAARQLVGLDGIDIAADLTGIRYHHMLFDRHEVVISNGAETESLHTGRQALLSVGPAARAEILAIFPELRQPDHQPRGARLLVPGSRGRRLAARHAKSRHALVAS
ncbi:Hint domain-containing protein [Pontibaca methylaminivorans]|uniref:Hint domain-containing protein n=1 Tax=Pontibaca methylaminivorans TaxID=515897 RepID=A0A1R3WK59_9RHOB|nr:Hint domain-containing protein [Pontibaca methylaminivorans]SIT76993.1 Hint domain-containing protein [Pontibaca methylaminivorans]